MSTMIRDKTKNVLCWGGEGNVTYRRFTKCHELCPPPPLSLEMTLSIYPFLKVEFSVWDTKKKKNYEYRFARICMPVPQGKGGHCTSAGKRGDRESHRPPASTPRAYGRSCTPRDQQERGWRGFAAIFGGGGDWAFSRPFFFGWQDLPSSSLPMTAQLSPRHLDQKRCTYTTAVSIPFSVYDKDSRPTLLGLCILFWLPKILIGWGFSVE